MAAGGQLAVCVARLAPRLVGHDEDERVQPGVLDVDPPEALFDDLLSSDFTRAQPASELLDGERWNGDHDRGPTSGGRRPSDASWLKSAPRNARVARASVSRIGFSSGRPRRSASAIAACSHWSMVMISFDEFA